MLVNEVKTIIYNIILSRVYFYKLLQKAQYNVTEYIKNEWWHYKVIKLKNGDIYMNRNEIYHQIEEIFGLIPSMFKSVPDQSLEQEWELFKMLELDDGPIPQKYRELMGVAVSAATKCRYCELFHTELAKLHGATEEEIENALHYAKHTSGWSTYINGLQIDFDQFTSEINRASDYIRKSQREKASVK